MFSSPFTATTIKLLSCVSPLRGMPFSGTEWDKNRNIFGDTGPLNFFLCMWANSICGEKWYNLKTFLKGWVGGGAIIMLSVQACLHVFKG